MDPGLLPPGEHKTVHFLDGLMTVAYPSPWESHVDQPVEFSSAPAGKWEVHRVLFWENMVPVKNGTTVSTVGDTTSAWLTWLAGRENITVSSPVAATIGQAKLPATAVDIAIAPNARNEDPNCPAKTCVVLWSFSNTGAPARYGLVGPEVVRLYFADVSYSASQHLLVVAVDGSDAADLKAWLPEALTVVNSFQAPIEPAH